VKQRLACALNAVDGLLSEGSRKARSEAQKTIEERRQALQRYRVQSPAPSQAAHRYTRASSVRDLEAQAQRPKVVVWAHNSHLGDARATHMGEAGELNLGQLVRQRYGRAAVLIGFTTYHGTVTAASTWGGPGEHKHVHPALPESYEALFHDLGLPRFLLVLNEDSDALQALRQPRLERAIGVIYLPETERISHYIAARLADQFDAVLHFDATRAVEPLERTAEWELGRVPDTFLSGL
jgi:erythromycin esterase-like protein